MTCDEGIRGCRGVVLVRRGASRGYERFRHAGFAEIRRARAGTDDGGVEWVIG